MREGLRQAMAWLHTWAGLLFGWLLFAIFLTGTMSYFKEEITHWTQPEIPHRQMTQAQVLENAQRYLEANAAGSSSWFMRLPDERTPALQFFWRNPDPKGEPYIFKRIDPQTLQEDGRQTLGGEFFFRFHYQLQMPYPWGRWLSSLAALFMLVVLVSGIITHKKIFKEFFTFRPGKGQRSWLDGHNAIGVLILPFYLMIGYSSLIIFMTMLMPAGLLAGYGKNTRAFFNDVFPSSEQVQAAGEHQPLMPLPELYAKAQQNWGAFQAGRVEVSNPGDRNARVSFSRNGSERIVHTGGDAQVFDGTTGQLLKDADYRSSPLVIAAGLYGLHMGEFAGAWLRWLYFACGVAGTGLIGTGLVMWLSKRQLKHAASGSQPRHLRLVEVLNVASMAGLMVATLAFFWANRVVPAQLAGREDIEIQAFFITWGLTFLHAALRPGRKAWLEQLGLAILLALALPLLDIKWQVQTTLQGDWTLLGVDLTWLACGLFMLWGWNKIRRGSARPVRKPRAAAAPRLTEGEAH